MADIILVTGGARSGKSRHAQELCEQLPGPRVFVATCQAHDDEMAERIRRHRKSRDSDTWNTIEEPLEIPRILSDNEPFKVVLVDCLTLWISNLMGASESELTEDDVEQRCRDILTACKQRNGTVVFVTNEVGNGIVPNNPMARKYRDLVGRCNQTLGAGADQVTLVTCGVPMNLKGEQ